MSEAKFPGSAPEVDPQIAAMAERIAMEAASDSLREQIWMRVSSTAEAKPDRIPFTLSPGRRWALGGLVVASVGVGLALWALPGSPGRPTPAFAEVTQAMGNIRTVSWRQSSLNITSFRADGTFENRPHKGSWIMWGRLDQPALATEYSKGLRRVSFANESYQIDEERMGGKIRGYQRLRWGIPPSLISGSGKDQTPRERILNSILFPPNEAENKAPWTESSPYSEKETIERTPWKSREAVLDGKKVIRFDTSVRFKERVPEKEKTGDTKSFPWRNTEDFYTLWVEPDTYRLVRREVRVRMKGPKDTVDYTTVSDQFRYNQEPPAGIFDYLPPVGSRFLYVPLAQRTAKEAEQADIEQVIRRAMEAWNKGDTRGYAACWDFDYEARSAAQNRLFAEREMELIRTRKPFKEWRILNIHKAQTRVGGIFTRHTSEDAFPPKESNEFLALITAQVTETSGRNRTIVYLVNLRRDDDGFRLIRNFADNAARFNSDQLGKPVGTPTRRAGRP